MKKFWIWLKKSWSFVLDWNFIWVPVVLLVVLVFAGIIVPAPTVDGWKVSFEGGVLAMVGIEVSLLIYKLGSDVNRAVLDSHLEVKDGKFYLSLKNLSLRNYATNLTYYVFSEFELVDVGADDATEWNLREPFLVKYPHGKCYRAEGAFIPCSDSLIIDFGCNAPDAVGRLQVHVKAENAKTHSATFVTTCNKEGRPTEVFTIQEYEKITKKVK